ncbi:MAG: YjbH domain-containing protein [Rhodobacteraceae bacterium]|nr:YjbH domain-containing protein [Paracoccaceae bacterium]
MAVALLACAVQVQTARAQQADVSGFTPLPQPSLNFYGAPGLIDMPSGEAAPDGQFTFSVSNFAGITRTTLSFQATPRISASFRYAGIQDWNSNGFDTYYDRSFDVRFLVLPETRRLPAVTVGLQDFVGTGIYAGEYVAATKTFMNPGIGSLVLPGRVKVTAGLGWGRLGSSGSIGSPFGANRPVFDPNSTGGQVSYDQWFRGPAAPFGGIEWQPTDRLGLKLEYSSDAYTAETATRNVFDRRSRINFGAEYEVSRRVRLGGYYLYGAEAGVSLQFQLNPQDPVTPFAIPGPVPVPVRPDATADPAAWSTAWAGNAAAPAALRDALSRVMAGDGLLIEALRVDAHSAELRYRNARYMSQALGLGRAARAMALVLPASVETFRLVPMRGGLALSEIVIRRSDLEALEFDAEAAAALLAVTGIGDATPDPAADAATDTTLYPEFFWSISPFVAPSYFDPDSPVRADAGVEFAASYRFAPGWIAAGRVRHRLAGNITDATRFSNSVLPRVRTDALRYAQATDTSLEELYIARQWKPASDLYARVSFGYLEKMFAGLSTELLWKPASTDFALGVEANYVRQRAYDQRFGLRDYSVATGHVSAYYDIGQGFHAQLDVGRYLAGDLGATLTVDREFDNGWSVGGFFTLTDVSAAEFGEGSFDKGIRFTIPVNWFLGKPSQQSVSATIRPVQRDGGARLRVPGRLYEQIRDAHRAALEDQWARVWE